MPHVAPCEPSGQRLLPSIPESKAASNDSRHANTCSAHRFTDTPIVFIEFAMSTAIFKTYEHLY